MDREVLENILMQMKNFKEEMHKEEKSETMVFYGNFDPTEPILSVSLSSIYPLLFQNNNLRNLCFNCLARDLKLKG